MSETNETMGETTTPVSRRDFLRRAGKQAVQEAVTTGERIVPGAAVAKVVLGDQKTGKPSLFKAIANWKQKRTETPEASGE